MRIQVCYSVTDFTSCCFRRPGLVCVMGISRVVGCYWCCCAHWHAYWLGESQPHVLWGVLHCSAGTSCRSVCFRDSDPRTFCPRGGSCTCGCASTAGRVRSRFGCVVLVGLSAQGCCDGFRSDIGAQHLRYPKG